MTIDTAAPPRTARELLFGAGAVGAARQLSRTLAESGAAQSATQALRHLSGSAARAVDEEVGAVAAELLDLDLGDALVLGWRRWTALVEAARRTLASPGSEEVVELATHRVTSQFRPSIDLLVDGIRVNTFELHLSLVFDLTGISAVVRGGELAAVRGGDIRVTARLTLEGARLAEVERLVDVALVLPLRPAVPLTGAGDPPVVRQESGREDRGTGQDGSGSTTSRRPGIPRVIRSAPVRDRTA